MAVHPIFLVPCIIYFKSHDKQPWQLAKKTQKLVLSSTNFMFSTWIHCPLWAVIILYRIWTFQWQRFEYFSCELRQNCLYSVIHWTTIVIIHNPQASFMKYNFSSWLCGCDVSKLASSKWNVMWKTHSLVISFYRNS